MTETDRQFHDLARLRDGGAGPNHEHAAHREVARDPVSDDLLSENDVLPDGRRVQQLPDHRVGRRDYHMRPAQPISIDFSLYASRMACSKSMPSLAASST